MRLRVYRPKASLCIKFVRVALALRSIPKTTTATGLLHNMGIHRNVLIDATLANVAALPPPPPPPFSGQMKTTTTRAAGIWEVSWWWLLLLFNARLQLLGVHVCVCVFLTHTSVSYEPGASCSRSSYRILMLCRDEGGNRYFYLGVPRINHYLSAAECSPCQIFSVNTAHTSSFEAPLPLYRRPCFQCRAEVGHPIQRSAVCTTRLPLGRTDCTTGGLLQRQHAFRMNMFIHTGAKYRPALSPVPVWFV